MKAVIYPFRTVDTVRRLVEAHGGEIRIDSPPGGGASVTVSLPLA